MFDCHVHSIFSGDCDTAADNSCKAAIEAGLEGIAFTDHLDIDYPVVDILFNIDFSKYSAFMDKLKPDYAGRLKVLKGIEVGLQPHVAEETNRVVETYVFDYVIGSVHVIDGVDPYYGKYFAGRTMRDAYARYLQTIDQCLDIYTDFDAIGHIGYLVRYADYEDRMLRHADYSDLLDSILIKLVHLGKGLEINSSGYRNGLGEPIPGYDIVERFAELGGEIFCLGSDAHFAEHVGHSFTEIRKQLLDKGIRHAAYFENRKPVFYRL